MFHFHFRILKDGSKSNFIFISIRNGFLMLFSFANLIYMFFVCVFVQTRHLIFFSKTKFYFLTIKIYFQRISSNVFLTTGQQRFPTRVSVYCTILFKTSLYLVSSYHYKTQIVSKQIFFVLDRIR